MSVSVYKTFSAGEVLTAADLNASLVQITSNGTDVAFPLTKNSSLGGYSLFFDAASTRSMTDSTKGVNLVLTAFNDTKTTVASAATPDIWTGTGRLIDYTGTVTCTGFAAASQAGSTRNLLCAAAAPFTAGANMLIDGYQSGATFTAGAGDQVDVTAVTTTQFRLRPRLYNSPALLADNSIFDFRLTLTTAVPVTTSDVTAATTLYCTPYVGNCIALYDGANWNIRTSAEFSITNSGLAASKPHDVFCYDNAGVPTLELLVWTNSTTRATALTTQNGVLVKTGATTRRYVGTIYTDSASKFSDSYALRHVWNYRNRVVRPMRALETADTWDYTIATLRQARATATNQLDFVIGWNEDMVAAHVHGFAKNTGANVDMIIAIGLDSTTTMATGCINYSGVSQVANQYIGIDAHLETFPDVGRHTLVWLELSVASGTTTWAGDAGSPTTSQSGIHGWTRA